MLLLVVVGPLGCAKIPCYGTKMRLALFIVLGAAATVPAVPADNSTLPADYSTVPVVDLAAPVVTSVAAIVASALTLSFRAPRSMPTTRRASQRTRPRC